MPELDGEIALVTGASRGLGAAIASALAARGARVFGTATSEAGAAAIGERLGGPERGLVLDVRDSAVVTFVLDTLKERAGDPGILVNNAGVTRDNLLLRMREEEWQDVLDTDLTSIYRLCKAALRGMTRARKGRIINIASVVGLTGNPGQCNYAAAKAGIIGFSKALGPRGGVAQHHRERRCAGIHRYGHDQRARRRAAGGARGAHPARAPGDARGHRTGGGLSRVARRCIHHRRDAARQRRHVHALKAFTHKGFHLTVAYCHRARKLRWSRPVVSPTIRAARRRAHLVRP
jgi:NADP-dependent 3-hydroxy acid dehydrogenase YdfG